MRSSERLSSGSGASAEMPGLPPSSAIAMKNDAGNKDNSCWDRVDWREAHGDYKCMKPERV